MNVCREHIYIQSLCMQHHELSSWWYTYSHKSLSFMCMWICVTHTYTEPVYPISRTQSSELHELTLSFKCAEFCTHAVTLSHTHKPANASTHPPIPTNTRACARAHLNVRYIYIQICVWEYVCIFTYICIHIITYIYIYTCICVRVYIGVCMSVCVSVNIYVSYKNIFLPNCVHTSYA